MKRHIFAATVVDVVLGASKLLALAVFFPAKTSQYRGEQLLRFLRIDLCP